MGEFSTEIFDGGFQKSGWLNDLIQIRDLSILVDPAPAPPHRTPDLDTSVADSELERPLRACLSLDHGYVTMTSVAPRLSSRPVPYSKFTEKALGSETVPEDDVETINLGYVGAVAKLSDIFHISTSDGELITPDGLRSFKDRFGLSIPDVPGRSRLFFGRLEHRIGSHYYADDVRTGPLLFSKTRIPPRSGVSEPGFRYAQPIAEEGRPTTDPDTGDAVDPTLYMGTELLPGDLRMHPDLRAWMPVSAVNATLCFEPGRLINLIPRLESERDGCADVGAGFTARLCDATAGAPLVKCPEIGPATLQEKYLLLAERLNIAMLEIDSLYCLIKQVGFCLSLAKEAEGTEPTVDCTLCA